MSKSIKIGATLLAIVLFVSMFSVFSVAASASSTSYLRFIQLRHLDTLDENSKWRQEPLKSKLINALSDDLSDTKNCEQVWEFSADEYEKVHEWCLEHDKGEQTNEEFLKEFAKDHRIQYKKG